MTALAWLFLAAAAVAALANWYAVAGATRHGRLEFVAKPATILALIGVAETMTPDDTIVRAFVALALVLSLIGDVALMLPRERFVGGLVAFLFAHLAYIVGLGILVARSGSIVGAVVGLVLVGLVVGSVGRRVFAAVGAQQAGLLGPVVAYMAVISLMVVVAFATGRPLAMAGAALFYASDATLAWNRFVERRAWGRIAVIATYHVGQALLVLSLASPLLS
ncbi:MAG: lysoplasmalogenase [Candidatus Limnocylindrales bacterium]